MTRPDDALQLAGNRCLIRFSPLLSSPVSPAFYHSHDSNFTPCPPLIAISSPSRLLFSPDDARCRILLNVGRSQLNCDATRAETRFRLSAKRTSPFKLAGASVQSTTGSRGVRISGSNAGYTMFRGSVKGTGYPLHSPVSPSLPLPYASVCHHVSTRLYLPTHTPSGSLRICPCEGLKLHNNI